MNGLERIGMRCLLATAAVSLLAFAASGDAEARTRGFVGLSFGVPLYYSAPAYYGPPVYYAPPPVYYPPPSYYYPPPPPRVVYSDPPPPAQACREYQTSGMIDGRMERLYGTACLQPDGSWQFTR